jgi:site-specific DNA-methyltransferase (adenine-specific)
MIDKPIVNLDSANTIIGGHQRKHVLESTGVKEIECWIPDRELTEREVEELNIRLNKNTGSWDFDVLANEFELDDLLEWGFDKKELDIDLWAGEAPEDVEPQIDKAEELREKWGVETGQLWQLGEHRLVCGDCTDRAVVERVMGGEVAGAVVTDPPYGINLDTDLSAIKTNWKGWEGQGGNYSPVIGDDKPFNPAHLFEYFNCAEMFLWGADYFAEKLPNRNEGSWLVWDKRVNEKTGADLSWGIGSEFELCWSKTKHKRDVIRKLWSGLYGTETQDVRKRIHPTQKPLEVIEWILEKYIKQSENIVDPYLGSGTTLIACERLGRKCRAVEISPAYVAVAIQRWVDVTGGEPVLLTL